MTKRKKKTTNKSMSETLKGKSIEDEAKNLKSEIAASLNEKPEDFLAEAEADLVEIATLLENNSLSKVVSDLIIWISEMKSSEDISKLVFFLVLAATDATYAAKYEKFLPPSCIVPSLWDAKDKYYTAAGAIGCALLSTKTEDLPPALVKVKSAWVSKNGGYANCFTINKIVARNEMLSLTPPLRLASAQMTEAATSSLIGIISKKCPELAFGMYGYSFMVLSQATLSGLKVIGKYVPSTVKDLAVRTFSWIMSWLTQVIAALCILTVVHAHFTRKTGEGLLTKVVYNVISIIDFLAVYLFGSREKYVTFVVIVVSAVTVPYLPSFPTIVSSSKLKTDFAETSAETFEILASGRDLEETKIVGTEVALPEEDDGAADTSTLEDRSGVVATPATRRKKELFTRVGAVSSTRHSKGKFPSSATNASSFSANL
jgi:hypothetical protein